MKRLIFFTSLVLTFILPMLVTAQDMTGANLEDIASSVVLIETLDGRRSLASGSGFIVSPDGLIYTNRHVIEGGNDFLIYMLADIRELPEPRFYASLQFVSEEEDIDFAVLKINRDANGSRLNPLDQNLPYIPPANTGDVSIGERIRVFGYPGIGDGYMVTTTGEVVTVQNGTIAGNRLPVWYWTDAEISSGNSGGLAVNTDGQPIGLPTWVVSEERTAGRLSGILPLVAIEHALAANGNLAGVIVQQGNAPTPGTTSPETGLKQLTIANESDQVICYVYVSPVTADNWGNDLLSNDEVIQSGQQQTWGLPSGRYDILLQDCDRVTLDDLWDVVIENTLTLAFTDSIEPQSLTNFLTISNRSTQSICYVYISPVDAADWGEDQLTANEIILAGGERSWEIPPGFYDVLLKNCDGDTLKDARRVDATKSFVLEYR